MEDVVALLRCEGDRESGSALTSFEERRGEAAIGAAVHCPNNIKL